MRVCMLLVFLVILLSPLCGQVLSQTSDNKLREAIERASKAANYEAVSAILTSILTDDAHIRSAYLMTPLDERTAFVLFSGDWGPRDQPLPQKEESRRNRLLVEAVAERPTLIRSVIRADRYAAAIVTQEPIVSHAGQPFFWGFENADDLIEWWVERLRRAASRPPQSVGPFSAEEWEIVSLQSLQMVCGVCDRLDLVEGSTVKNWRNRFSELDRWFQANRPFIMWDEARSCIRVDQEAKENAAPTGRKSRRVSELKPPWEFEGRSNEPRKPQR